MRKIGVLSGIVWLALCVVASGSRADGPRLSTEATPGFPMADVDDVEDFSELPELSTPISPLLINGVIADRRFFPTVFRKTSGSPCTASLIGPATMLTAAHCMTGDTHVRFKLRDQRVRGFCERAPGYSDDRSKDWALCLLEFPILDIRYETLDVTVPSPGSRVTLTGYGCNAPGGPSDGSALRVGIAGLVSRPATFPAETSTIYTKSVVATGGVVVCPGDSGGPLFVIPSGSFNGTRTIVGVNSRSALSHGVSLFSAVGSAAGSDFVKKWVDRRQQKICGVNLDEGCR